jgi:hypothetical protein
MIVQSMVLLFVTVLTGAVPDPPPGREVVASTAASMGRIDRLLVDYYLTSEDDHQPARTDRFVEAFDHDRYYADDMHFMTPGRQPWHDADRRQEWAFPDRVTIYTLFSRQAKNRKPAPGVGVPSSPYLTCIGWRPRSTKPTIPAQAQPFFLTDVLSAGLADQVTVEAGRVTVDGLSCYVLTADGGHNCTWVCPDRGYAVVKRVIRRRTEDGADFEGRCGEFVEAAPGVWLPRRCEGVYTWVKGPTRRRTFRIEATHLVVNGDVSDDQFRPSFAPGALVFDEDGALVATVPGGADHLDHWVIYGKTFFPPKGGPMVVQAEDYTLMCVGVTLIAWGVWLSQPSAPRRAACSVLDAERAVRCNPG